MNKPDIEKKSKELYNYMLNQLADMLNKARLQKNVSIRELNRISGVSTAVISDMENKVYLPKPDAIIRISIALDIPLEEILSSMLPPDKVLTQNSNSSSDLINSLTSLGLDKKEKEEIITYITFLLYKKSMKKELSYEYLLKNNFQNYLSNFQENYLDIYANYMKI